MDIVAKTFTEAEWNDGTARVNIEGVQKRCNSHTRLERGSVEFPSEQPNMVTEAYFTSSPEQNQFLGVITDEIISGKSIIAFLYCVLYETEGVAHHTAFTYYYQGYHVRPDHLGVAEMGNDAD